MKSFQISREFDWPAWLNFLCLIPQHRAGILLYLIERAKKCLDFSATLYIIHLFICIVYGGWPSSLTWWIVNVTGLAVMALLGEYLCIKRELREIPITRYRSSVWLSRCSTANNIFPSLTPLFWEDLKSLYAIYFSCLWQWHTKDCSVIAKSTEKTS